MKNSIILFLIIITISSLTSAQTLDWAKNMGGTDWAEGRSIAIDGSGNVYTTGYFNGTVDFDPGAGTSNLTSRGFSDIFIQKLDASGNLLWVKKMGGSTEDQGFSIALDDSGNVYTTGFYQGTVDFDPNSGTSNLSPRGVFIQKLNSDGNLLWAKSIGEVLYGGEGYGIAVDDFGNVYTTGKFQGTIDFDPNAGTTNLTAVGSWTDIFVQKLDRGGNLVWAKSMGGTDPDEGHSIAVDGSGNVYTTGTFRDSIDFDPNPGSVNNLISVGFDDIFIQKLDENGNFLWAKSLGGPEWDNGSSIAVDDSGNVYTTGWFLGMVDFDTGPNVQNLSSVGSSFTSDIFILKLNTEGNFKWAKSMGGSSFDNGNSIAIDGPGNVYITGSFRETVDFDPNAGASNIAVEGESDIFIQKVDPGGNFIWVKSMGGTDSEAGFSIEVDGMGNIYTTGSFRNKVDFDPGVDSLNMTAIGIIDIFIQKLNQELNTSISPKSQTTLSVYPNPTTGKFKIELPAGTLQTFVQIVNSLGKTVYKQQLWQPEQEMDLSHLPSGMYHITFELNSGEKLKGKIMLK